MFFQSWSGLARVLVIGFCAYAGLARDVARFR
jgi:hypothetical protein